MLLYGLQQRQERECVCIDEYGSQQQFNLIKDPQRNDFISE